MPVREPTSAAIAACWSALLDARAHVARGGGSFALADTGDHWVCATQPDAVRAAAAAVVVALDPEPAAGALRAFGAALPAGAALHELAQHGGGDALTTHAGAPLPAAMQGALLLYLPLLHGQALARRAQRPFVTVHLTQSVDGRIAGAAGRPLWLGNEADREHTHRLRALHAAVLVGGRTVLADDPQLTVRAVAGPQPRRVVLSGCASVLGHDRRVLRDAGCLLLATRAGLEGRAVPRAVEVAALDGGGTRIDGGEVAQALWARGLDSVLVEGGGATASSFVLADRVDRLHLHFAPLVLGAGVASFALPSLAGAGGRRLHGAHFVLDGELLFACSCAQPGAGGSA